MSNIDPTLQNWLQKYKLESCTSSIIEAGVDEYGVIEQLDEEMIQSIIEDANLNKSVMHRVMFKKGVSDVINGVYNPFTQDEQKNASIPEKASIILRETDREMMDGKRTKTIIFIGESGCGKTTTINSMLNYLEEVSYDNSFRFRVPNDLRDDEFISKYHFRTLPTIHYALNIIDTQGFGDFVGVKQNDKMRQDYKEYLQSVASIDGIYFVFKATETTMSSNQRLFKMIANLFIELFGEKVKDNISIIFTFSDGADPPAMKTVKKLQIPYKKCYTINNSAFGENRSFVNEHMFAEGMEEFQALFNDLEEFSTSVSAKLSPELLYLSEYIDTWTSSIDIYLKPAMNQFYSFCETYQHLRKYKKQINKDPNYNQIPHSFIELFTNPENNKIESRPIISLLTKKEIATKYRVHSGKIDDIMKVIHHIMDTLEQQIIFTIMAQAESLKKFYKLMDDPNDKQKEQLTTAIYFDILVQLEFEHRDTGFRERIGILTDLKTKSKQQSNTKISVQEIMNLYVFWQQYFSQNTVNALTEKYEKEKKQKNIIEKELNNQIVRHNKTLEKHRLSAEQIDKQRMTERYEAKMEIEKVKIEAQYSPKSQGDEEEEDQSTQDALVDKYVNYFGEHYPFEASIVTYYAAIVALTTIGFTGDEECGGLHIILGTFVFIIFLALPGIVEGYKYCLSKDENKSCTNVTAKIIGKMLILAILMLSVELEPFSCLIEEGQKVAFQIGVIVIGIVAFILHGALCNGAETEEELAEEIGKFELQTPESKETTTASEDVVIVAAEIPVDDIVLNHWLKDMKMEKYYKQFKDNGYDLGKLVDIKMNVNDLKFLGSGVKYNDKLTLMKAVNALDSTKANKYLEV